MFLVIRVPLNCDDNNTSDGQHQNKDLGLIFACLRLDQKKWESLIVGLRDNYRLSMPH